LTSTFPSLVVAIAMVDFAAGVLVDGTALVAAGLAVCELLEHAAMAIAISTTAAPC
jgi:hypothetical protein